MTYNRNDIKLALRQNCEQSKYRPTLQFDLSNKGISHEDVEEMIQQIEKLQKYHTQKTQTVIFLINNCIDDISCKILSKFNSKRFRYLNLADNFIGQYGCKYLSKGFWPNLQYLQFNRTNIDDKACKHLTKGYWPRLKKLYLGWSEISEKSCEYLSKGRWSLETLYIYNCPIRNRGWIFLKDINWGVMCLPEYR